MKAKKYYLPLFIFQAFSLLFAARIFNLSNYGLWADEVFSVRTAKLDWAALFDKTIYDVVHPPLFYAVLKVWIILGGDSLAWLKTLPVLFAVSAMLPLGLLCRELKISQSEFCLALIFTALNAYQIHFAQELRMYSLLACLSLWSMWLFVKYLKEDAARGRTEIILLLVNLLLVYTHYFGWFTISAELALVFFWRKTKFKRFFIQTFLVGLGFLPWGCLVFAAVLGKGGLGENLGWMSKPALPDVFLFFAGVQGTAPIQKATTAGFLIFLPPVLLWIRQIVRRKSPDDALIFAVLSSISVLPVVAAFILSQILQTSLWSDRYFIAAAAPYALLLAVGISRINNVRLKNVFLTLSILAALGAGALNIFYYRTRIDWTSVSHRIADDSAAPVDVFVLEEWLEAPLRNSLDYTEKGKFNVAKVDDIGDIDKKKFWFGYRQTTWREPESPRQKFEKKNCTVGGESSDEVFNEKVTVFPVECG